MARASNLEVDAIVQAGAHVRLDFCSKQRSHVGLVVELELFLRDKAREITEERAT